MAVNISRAGDGTVTFDFGVGIDPLVLTDSNNIVVNSEETNNSIGTIIRQDLSFIRTDPYFFYQITYSQIGTINGSPKPAIGDATTTLLETAVFQGTSGGGGDIPIGTDRQVLGYDNGEPTAVTLGWKQFSDLPTPPPFSNGVLTGTAFNESGDALFAFVQLDVNNTAVPTSIPLYSSAGRITVVNGAANGDAVNLSQLNAKANIASPTFTGVVTSPSFVGPLTGLASTATALATGRTFSITGGATGTSAAFNGSANATIAVTLAVPTSVVRGGVLMQPDVPDIAIAPTASDFNNLLDALRNAGVLLMA